MLERDDCGIRFGLPDHEPVFGLAVEENLRTEQIHRTGQLFGSVVRSRLYAHHDVPFHPVKLTSRPSLGASKGQLYKDALLAAVIRVAAYDLYPNGFGALMVSGNDHELAFAVLTEDGIHFTTTPPPAAQEAQSWS